jgi:hypothetical protein
LRLVPKSEFLGLKAALQRTLLLTERLARLNDAPRCAHNLIVSDRGYVVHRNHSVSQLPGTEGTPVYLVELVVLLSVLVHRFVSAKAVQLNLRLRRKQLPAVLVVSGGAKQRSASRSLAALTAAQIVEEARHSGARRTLRWVGHLQHV